MRRTHTPSKQLIVKHEISADHKPYDGVMFATKVTCGEQESGCGYG